MSELGTPTSRFAALFADRAHPAPLDEAALLIAAHAHPSLDVATYLRRLDDLAARVGEPTVEALVEVVFHQEGLKGNRADYYDLENSFVDSVLDRGLGIPISLAVVTLEVGRRCGVGLVGVGMPGHFLLRTTAEPIRFVDAFGGGTIVGIDGCEAIFRQSQGPDIEFSPALLTDVGTEAIINRMLANLLAIARSRNDGDLLRWVLSLRVSLADNPLSERAELAKALSSSGRLVEAADQWEILAARTSGPASTEATNRANQLRALLN